MKRLVSFHFNKNSVIVTDNASYHNVQINPPPTSLTKKADMINWLKNHYIPCSPSMLKPELYVLIKQNKPTYKTFKIDAILANHGHSVSRLPPYQPDFSLTELTLATVNVNRDFGMRLKEKTFIFSVDSVKGILLYFSCLLYTSV